MVCAACGRTTDPARSFCQNCGSSVFVEDRQKGPLAALASAVASRTEPGQTSSMSDAPAVRRKAPKGARPPRIQQQRATTSASVGCLGSLIRLAIFIGIIWYGWGFIDRYPQVRAVKEAYRGGQITDLESAITVITHVIDTGEAPVATRSNQPPPPATPPAGREVAESASNTPLPPGVYLPGGDVTAPRVVRQVRPTYTAAARAARIEGNVVLKGIVQTNGTISDIALVRSLDEEYGLDAQAMSALQQWRFEPGMRGGMPVPVMIQVGLSFSLRAPTGPAAPARGR